MAVAGLKNYALANYLQYDVSYISKWINGKIIPSEKNASLIIEEISKCIVETADDNGKKSLYAEYQVKKDMDLKQAIFDNLVIEYDYVRELKSRTGMDVAPETLFYPRLSFSQYISKMKHPVLRKVQLLNVIAAIDILYFKYDDRRLFMDLENEHISQRVGYPGVNFSLLINLEWMRHKYVQDSIFIMNILDEYSNINLQLHESCMSYGKLIFIVKNMYSISGMLVDRNSCLAVTSSENKEYCSNLYENIKELCTGENLLFQRKSLQDVLKNSEYALATVSTNLRWILGYMTEQMLPSDLFDEILEENHQLQECRAEFGGFQKNYNIVKQMICKSKIKILLQEKQIVDFAISGAIDFFGYKIFLTEGQRRRCIEYILNILEFNNLIEIRLISKENMCEEYHLIKTCLYLTDTISYVRIGRQEALKNIAVLNNYQMKESFDNMFEKIWGYSEFGNDQTSRDVREFLQCILETITMICK